MKLRLKRNKNKFWSKKDSSNVFYFDNVIDKDAQRKYVKSFYKKRNVNKG